MLLYNLSIWFYWLFVRLAAPFHTKAKLMVKGRQNMWAELEAKLKGNTAPVAWFHCASLGEFEQGRPVIEAFAQQYPEYKIALSFFSPSGYEVRKNYAGAHYIFYLPKDSATNARKMVSLLRPKLAVFVKYEFWHYFTQELKNQNVPVISISTIFREGQLFFKPYGGFYRNILRNFSWFFTQNLQSDNLLKSIQINNVSVAGDTRFDRVLQTAASVKTIPVVEAFKAGKEIFVIGSSWPEDMQVLVPFLKKYQPELKFIIAPHEIHENEIAALCHEFAGTAIRFSEVKTRDLTEYSVLIIDNIGMLSSLYGYGSYAFIGGAFGKGLHNTLEAAVFGLPLFFGPKYEKFQEAKDLVALQTAFPVNNFAELETVFENVKKPETKNAIAARQKTYIAGQAGATQKIMDWISATL
ncbi:3-deoxy-D-manno-octulosonic acid transferase [Adhaeribacter sp. BT258]|uniref:3-deoxy-D-manno-octulosonic acid transferase n=1 Tax=Adhaeribacter terrigena TaxID=2793070 RepID=A0ABS1BYF4_9BACT|nr:glycosyltransferase N-terminal domain-containing protein [Adhaeribacter terrigena]MBK0402083.1 3-deoxy-D-manno-octulosonic acid transferase [Adhaeribacter terrigena]